MTNRNDLLAALAAFVAGRTTDFPVADADPITAHHETSSDADEFPRDEAELAAAIRLLAFLRDAAD